MDFLQAVLEHFGLRERVEMNYIAASEPDGFRDILSAFTEKIRKLGPSPVKGIDVPRRELKRETLLGALEALQDRLGLKLQESIPLDRDLVVGGFGHPVYDADKCIGCAACYHSCPRHNIEMETVDGVRRISYFHSLCDTCTTCRDICPVGAITVEKRSFDLGAFVARKRFPAASVEMRGCEQCGEHFVPARQVEHLLQQDAARGLEPDNLLLCERCRRERHARSMQTAHRDMGANATRGVAE
jgi:formate hydrogenlyase subunit 6/NADH:ubiquinone oxidoreductase subunit I